MSAFPAYVRGLTMDGGHLLTHIETAELLQVYERALAAALAEFALMPEPQYSTDRLYLAWSQLKADIRRYEATIAWLRKVGR